MSINITRLFRFRLVPSTDFWETPPWPLPEPQMKEGWRGPFSDQAPTGRQGDSVTKARGVSVSPGSLPVPLRFYLCMRTC